MSARLPLKDHIFISEFAAFCRSKGDEEYDSLHPRHCALGQFGHPGICTKTDCSEQGVPWSAYYAAALDDGPYNFASLATRLESLLSDMTVGVDR